MPLVAFAAFFQTQDGFDEPEQRRAGRGVAHGHVDVRGRQMVQGGQQQIPGGQDHGGVGRKTRRWGHMGFRQGIGREFFLQGLELGVQIKPLHKTQARGGGSGGVHRMVLGSAYERT